MEAVEKARWMRRARCRGMDAEVFYPPAGGYGYALEAKAVCEECPVKEICLRWALEHRETEGIWGGLTYRQRRRLSRERRAAALAAGE